MPHARLHVTCSLQEIIRKLPLLKASHNEHVVKILDIYHSISRQRALVLVLTAEPRVTYRFYVELIQKAENEILIRLDRLTNPEKTEGVFFLLHQLVQKILEMAPGHKIIQTNLPQYIINELHEDIRKSS